MKALIQAIHKKPAPLISSRMNLIIEALFQSRSRLNPRAPSFLGKQTGPQSTLAPPEAISFPFQREALHLPSTTITTFVGGIKALHQKLIMECKTY
ncbi:hypothetical protein CDL15_Pgr021468 [Punica granatum]|uniref:Uncharacterized protein n=1 Tax=Punica granatum TaxID=22663 RepID=A0A218XQ37_PUNGR|nr:hypothetical protein CDL15_Pgr021468 [Punica granatum]